MSAVNDRLVLVAARGDLSGASRWTALTAEALARRGLRVGVVYWYEGGTIADHLTASGLDVFVVHATSGRDFRAGFRLRRYIRQYAPDAIHYVDHSLAAVLAGRPNDARVTISCHTFPRTLRGKIRFSIAAAFAECCLVPSDALRDYIDRATLTSGRRSAVVPNIVAPPSFVRLEPSSWVLRIVVVSRLVMNKGLYKLPPLVEMLTSFSTRLRFDIYGDGPDRAALELALSRSAGTHTVRFHGAIDPVSEAFRSADVFLNLSDEETFGLAAAEAQAHGLPVIGVVPRSTLHETLAESGVVFVERNEPASLADALRPFIDDPHGEQRLPMGRQPHQRYLSRHTETRLTPRLQDYILGPADAR